MDVSCKAFLKGSVRSSQFLRPMITPPRHRTHIRSCDIIQDEKQKQADTIAWQLRGQIRQTEAIDAILMAELPLFVPSSLQSLVTQRLHSINKHLLAWGHFELNADNGKIFFLLPLDEVSPDPSEGDMQFAVDLIINTFLEYFWKFKELTSQAPVVEDRQSLALWMTFDSSWHGAGGREHFRGSKSSPLPVATISVV